MNNTALVLLLVCLTSLLGCSETAPPPTQADQPNIVLILVDDAGLMDFGAFGGEAETPNIDTLAANGTKFTNFHTSPMCAPSRAMLLTGIDSHQNGVPNLRLFLPSEVRKKPNYQGLLSTDVKTIATRLRNAGYATYMTGKWNLGHTDTTLPVHRGFDRSFILDASGADNWENRPYLPGQGAPPWFEDDKPSNLPDDFYSSEFLVDKMLSYIDEGSGEDRPFFAYVALQAIHIPVQAPRSFVKKYENTYSEGWGRIREARFERAKTLGLISQSAVMGEMLDKFPTWDSLTEPEQRLAAKSMAVNAAMLDAMDFHIGRLIEKLKQQGDYENTIFVVTSDNGPEGSAPAMLPGMNAWLESVGYRRDLETLGEKGSFVFIGPQFATAAAGPSAFFKFYAGEGGLRVPMIISGPGVPAGKQSHAFSFVTDVTPTLLELAGVTIDDKQSNTVHGRSWLPVLNGDSDRIYAEDEAIGMEAGGQAALFRGNYKITRNNPPHGDGQWRLYDLSVDPGETRDLSHTNSALFNELLSEYDNYANEVGVIEMPEGYELIKQIAINAAEAAANPNQD
ncbi:MAG: arylsulfatase [Pseudomonadota bacterium]